MATLTLQPYNGKIFGDTYLYHSSSSFSHYNTQKDYLETGLTYKGTAEDMYQFRTFMEFDLSSIPAGINIISAKLSLYCYSTIITGGCPDARKSPAIYTILEPWDENSLLLKQPKWDENYLAYVLNPTSNQWVEFDITNSVRAIYSGEKPNNGWVLKNMEDSYTFGWNSHLIFRSSTDTIDPTQRPKLDIIYEYIAPNPPTPIDPIGTYKDTDSSCRFSWKYNGQGGSIQKAFDLQWSTDQINWNIVSQTTANNYYDMPAGILPSGNIYWRVRTSNEYDLVSEYSPISVFYAIGIPQTPILNPVQTNSARPVVTWSAFNQQVYQLQVLSGDTIVYDSGVVPGINIRQHKIKAWLEDGEYTVRIRIKNEYDLWSEWGSAAVTISTVKPVKPTLTAQKTSTGIKLTVPVGRMLIYRDGMCIGETSTGEYIDNAVANGKDHEYVVRAIEGYPERQINNLLGADGDCEDISKWSQSGATISLSGNKVFGSNSIKLVSDTSANEHMIVHDTISAKPNSYYMLSAYIKPVSNSAFLRIVIFNSDSVVDIKAPDITDTSKFTRAIIKVQTGALAIGIQPRVKTEYASTIIYVDGVMLNEISESDYYTLTDDQLLAKYPFGNNTFMAPAIETFTDSDPVTATAEFSHALIAPVSDLSDVFTFSRSLNTPPKRTYNLQPGGAFVEYAGRKHPVWEPTEHVSAAWAMAFFLKSWNDVEAFIALVDRKETVLYRDAKGRKVYGVLGNLSVTDERGGHMVSFTLTEVDYNEELEV